MKRRILSILLTFAMALSIAPVGAFNLTANAEETQYTSGDYTYTVTDGDATITGVNTSISGDITIPSTLGGYPVTVIGNNAFEYGQELTDVTIPDSVTSIGSYAFYRCSSLTSVTIGNSVESIGDEAFSGCSSLTSVTIPNSVTSIGSGAFSGCSSLTSITIPDSVTSIGDDAFWGCTGLTSITIPDSVTSIGSGVFKECTSLTSVTIPDSVTSIGSYAFCFCDNLISIDLPNGITEIADHTFYNNDKLTTVIIPDSIVNIGDEAFAYCEKLTDITIPSSVKSIGFGAFYSCDSITSVSFPEGVINIGDEAFLYCYGLKNVTISSSVSNIGDSVFGNCSSLSSLTVSPENPKYHSDNNCLIETATNILLTGCVGSSIPDYVTSIGNHAFSWRYVGNSIEIPDSVTSIGERAFYWVTSLESVTIPANVSSIGDEAFSDCFYIESITVDLENKIYHSKDNCVVETATNTLVVGCKNSIIPNYVTSIGDDAFRGCARLTSVTIPDGVTSIGEDGFFHCDNLTSITLPKSVTSIGEYAFNVCENLTDVWYEGSESDREKISIGEWNNELHNAQWHYNSCMHSYAPATCTTPKTCEKCGDTEGEALGHDYDKGTVTKKPTCTAKGIKTFTCSVCKGTKTESIEATGHTYKTTTTKATLNKNGKIISKCAICDKVASTTTIYAVKTVRLSETSYVYDGKVKKPSVTVKDSKGKIVDSENYSVTYSNNRKKCGEYDVTVTFKGNYSGSKVLTFTIAHREKTIAGKAPTCTQTGLTEGKKCSGCGEIIVARKTIAKLLHNAVVLKAKAATCSTTGLTEGYECSVCDTIITPQNTVAKKDHSYKTTTTKATLSKNGKIVKKCTVCGKVASTTTIYAAKTVKLSSPKFTYTGKTIKPTLVVKTSKGKTISSKYYTVSGTASTKKIGKFKITLKFKGNYSGTKTLYYTINPKTVASLKLKAGKKQMTVSYKKDSSVGGYEIVYATNKSFKKAKTTKATSATKTIKKLTSKKTYYVKVRAYKKVSGKTYYGAYCKAKTVKVK